MSRRVLRLAVMSALAIFVLLGAITAPAEAADRDRSTILVKFSIPSQITGILNAFGDRQSARLSDGVVLVGLSGGTSPAAAVALYSRMFGVEYAEPNYIATADLAAPNDPSLSSQWGLNTISAVSGWSRLFSSYPTSTGGATIAVVDTGVQADHPDLTGRVLAGANCLSGTCTSGNSADDNRHGTHVAGIAAASTNNGVGVAGVALTSPILPVKVLDSTGSGSYAAITAGVNWAVSHGAQVINMSLSGTSPSTTLCNAVANAVSSGVVVVTAAGNNSSSSAVYPASCTGSIGVAATTSSDGAASFSNFGKPNVFVSAPGDSIYSTLNGSSYGTLSGTSMAAPYVAGLAALLRTQTPGVSVASVKNILATTSDKIGNSSSYSSDSLCQGCTFSSAYGYGRINVDRALGGGGSTPPPPPPPPPGDTEPPSIPTGLTASSSGTSISLSWNASSDNVGVTGYELQRCQGAGCSPVTTIATPTITSLVDSGLQASTTYRYRVRAKDAASLASGYSTIASATTAAAPPSSITTAFPTAVAVYSGRLVSGNAASLTTVDTNYYTVRNLFYGSPSWYGTFIVDPAASDFRVSYTGFASRTCTLSLAMYRWSTGAWVPVGTSRSIGTSQVTVTDQAPSASVPATDLRSSTGEVRVQVTCSAPTGATYMSNGNVLQLSYRS